MEPKPENVSGEIVRSHSFEHRIDWSHLIFGLAVLYIAMKLLGGEGSDFQSDSESDRHLID